MIAISAAVLGGGGVGEGGPIVSAAISCPPKVEWIELASLQLHRSGAKFWSPSPAEQHSAQEHTSSKRLPRLSFVRHKEGDGEGGCTGCRGRGVRDGGSAAGLPLGLRLPTLSRRCLRLPNAPTLTMPPPPPPAVTPRLRLLLATATLPPGNALAPFNRVPAVTVVIVGDGATCSHSSASAPSMAYSCPCARLLCLRRPLGAK